MYFHCIPWEAIINLTYLTYWGCCLKCAKIIKSCQLFCYVILTRFLHMNCSKPLKDPFAIFNTSLRNLVSQKQWENYFLDVIRKTFSDIYLNFEILRNGFLFIILEYISQLHKNLLKCKTWGLRRLDWKLFSILK